MIKTKTTLILIKLIVTANLLIAQTILWDNLYGPLYDELSWDMCKTTLGRYAVVGSQNVDGEYRPYFLLITENGQTIIERSYNLSYEYEGMRIIESSLGGFFLLCTGWRDDNIPPENLGCIIKTDSNGNPLRYYFQPLVPDAILEDENHDLILLGSEGRADSVYQWIARIDTLGNQMWFNEFTPYRRTHAHNLLRTSSGRIFSASHCYVDHPEYHSVALIAEYDHYGNIIAQRTFSEGQFVIPHDLIESQDGGLVLFGNAQVTNNIMHDSRWIAKASMDLDSVWSKVDTAGDANDREIGLEIAQLPDGTFVTAGYRQFITSPLSEPNLLITYFNHTGEFQSEYEFYSDRHELGQDLEVVNQSTIVILSSIFDSFFGELTDDIRVLSFQYPSAIVVNNTPSEFNLDIYPNPANPSVTIRYELSRASNVVVKIFDLLGRTVHIDNAGFKAVGSYMLIWEASLYQSGVYIVEVSTGSESYREKVVLLR